MSQLRKRKTLYLSSMTQPFLEVDPFSLTSGCPSKKFNKKRKSKMKMTLRAFSKVYSSILNRK